MPIPVRLDKTVRDRADIFVQVEFDKLRQETADEVSRESANLVLRGLGDSGAMISAIHNISAQQVQKRTDAVWCVLMRVMDGKRLPTECLREDLKTYMDYYVPVSLWELPELYERMGGKALYSQQFGTLLLQERERQLRRIHAEIDLYVDRLEAQAAAAPPVNVKEHDQKFGILLSPAQAARDFDDWATRLKPVGGSITVLFVDIDHFKKLNDRYTETVIDKTILPDAMRLLAGLVEQRGGGYRQGGDEFLLILPNLDKEEALVFAEKIRSRLASHQFRVEERTEALTISGGMAFWPEHGETYEAVLQKANQAKKAAKQTRGIILPAN